MPTAASSAANPAKEPTRRLRNCWLRVLSSITCSMVRTAISGRAGFSLATTARTGDVRLDGVIEVRRTRNSRERDLITSYASGTGTWVIPHWRTSLTTPITWRHGPFWLPLENIWPRGFSLVQKWRAIAWLITEG